MPKLSVSNLAWREADSSRVLTHLAGIGVRGVEVAPTRIAPWHELNATKIRAYRAAVEAEGLKVSSLQAIYFDMPQAKLLADNASFMLMSEHTKRVAEVGASLGAEIMVYGAPSTRKLGDQRADAVRTLASERFAVLGDIVRSWGIRIGIEPVPKTYGNDFLTSASEVLEFVRELSHPFVRLHLDTGCALLGGDTIEDSILEGSQFLDHFHAAEPHLGAFSRPEAHHKSASKALSQCGYDRWIVIEMREQIHDPIGALSTAVEYAISTYAIC